MRMRRLTNALVAIAACALACAAPEATAPPPVGAGPASEARLLDPASGFLAPNTQDLAGAPAYVHFTEDDMPLHVNFELPKEAARYESREATYAALQEELRAWERALQPAVPWFKLELVRGELDAPVQITWKKRLPGEAFARGAISWRVVDGHVRARGYLDYETASCDELYCAVDLELLRLAFVHEFGHTLGLGHCTGCDSVMADSWQADKRAAATELDLRTLRALYALPNGSLADGRPMAAFR